MLNGRSFSEFPELASYWKFQSTKSAQAVILLKSNSSNSDKQRKLQGQHKG